MNSVWDRFLLGLAAVAAVAPVIESPHSLIFCLSLGLWVGCAREEARNG